MINSTFSSQLANFFLGTFMPQLCLIASNQFFIFSLKDKTSCCRTCFCQVKHEEHKMIFLNRPGLMEILTKKNCVLYILLSGLKKSWSSNLFLLLPSSCQCCTKYAISPQISFRCPNSVKEKVISFSTNTTMY